MASVHVHRSRHRRERSITRTLELLASAIAGTATRVGTIPPSPPIQRRDTRPLC